MRLWAENDCLLLQRGLLAVYESAEVCWNDEDYEGCKIVLEKGVSEFHTKMAVWSLVAEGAPDPCIVKRFSKDMPVRVFPYL